MVITKPLATGEALEQTVAAIKRHADEATRELLIVEPSAARREQLVALLDGPDVSVTAVGTGADATAALERRFPDCLVLNPHLPDVTPLDLAKRLVAGGPARTVSMLVHGDPDGEDQVEAIKRAVPGLTVKDVRTEQRLLDQTALYLHRRFGDLSPAQRRTLSDLHGGSRALGGKKALIVDDDIRNIFALTSVLEEHHMLVVSAENGRDAIKTLQAYADIDVVVMDIMMPQMDGMETTRQIRLDPRFRHVPNIAVSARGLATCRSSFSPPTPTSCTLPAATRSAPSTISSARSCQTSSAPRSGCSSSWRGCTPRHAVTRKSGWRSPRSKPPGPPRRPTTSGWACWPRPRAC